VIAFCNDALNVDVLPADISIAHRLKADKKDATRPVIVRFTNRRVRNLKEAVKNVRGRKGVHCSYPNISRRRRRTCSTMLDNCFETKKYSARGRRMAKYIYVSLPIQAPEALSLDVLPI